MGAHGEMLQVPALPVRGHMRVIGDNLGNPLIQMHLAIRIFDEIIHAPFQGGVAIRPGFEKKNGRKQPIFSQNPQDIGKGRKLSGRGENRR